MKPDSVTGVYKNRLTGFSKKAQPVLTKTKKVLHFIFGTEEYSRGAIVGFGIGFQAGMLAAVLVFAFARFLVRLF